MVAADQVLPIATALMNTYGDNDLARILLNNVAVAANGQSPGLLEIWPINLFTKMNAAGTMQTHFSNNLPASAVKNSVANATYVWFLGELSLPDLTGGLQVNTFSYVNIGGTKFEGMRLTEGLNAFMVPILTNWYESPAEKQLNMQGWIICYKKP